MSKELGEELIGVSLELNTCVSTKSFTGILFRWLRYVRVYMYGFVFFSWALGTKRRYYPFLWGDKTGGGQYLAEAAAIKVKEDLDGVVAYEVAKITKVANERGRRG